MVRFGQSWTKVCGLKPKLVEKKELRAPKKFMTEKKKKEKAKST